MRTVPRFLFRSDASLSIGTGHVMRCLALADGLRRRGGECRFVCREHAGNLVETVRRHGFAAHALPAAAPVRSGANAGRDGDVPAHAAWLGADWATDARQTLDAVGGNPVDWLIVDHYALDIHWEQRLRPACRRLMVIDDLADRRHDCDWLLDQNCGRTAHHYADLVPATCRVLAGPEFALLRPEFAALRAYSLARRQAPRLQRLLITMGGIDRDNATGKVLNALRECPLPADCRISVVMGPMAPWLPQVRESAAGMPWVAEVLVGVQDMARLMAESDLAIGAAGVTSLERCCLGLPTITMVLADNQRVGARALEATGAVVVVDIEGDLAIQLRAKLASLAQPTRLRAMQEAAASVTDGTGTSRVVSTLLAENA